MENVNIILQEVLVQACAPSWQMQDSRSPSPKVDIASCAMCIPLAAYIHWCSCIAPIFLQELKL